MVTTGKTEVHFDEVSDTEAFAQDPYPYYKQLREFEPVQWSEKWQCWLVSAYPEVLECLTHPECYSNQGRVTGVLEPLLTPEQRAQLDPLFENYSKGLLNVDPPDHTRLKMLLLKAFRPRVNDALAAETTGIVNELMDAAQAKGKIELVYDFTFPLPVTVIARIMGVPEEDGPMFKKWSTQIVQFAEVPNPEFELILKSQEALLEMREYVFGEIRKRRQSPRDDLLTALAQAEEEGDKLTEDEILSSCVSILIGGHETTTKLMANTLWTLLHHPAAKQQIIDDPACMKVAMDEFLRFCGPFHRVRRVCREPVQLGGKNIAQGQSVMLLLASANRDPQQFDQADTLQITRQPNRHLAFGYGPHLCLGAPLARLEMEIAVPAILQRWPDLELDGTTWQWHNGQLRGLKALPLAF